MELTNEYVYNTVAEPVVGTLATEVVIIGMFFVAFAYMRHVIRDPRWMRTVEFWQRVVLLAVVMLFTVYIAAGYEIEFRRMITIRERVVVVDSMQDACAAELASPWIAREKLSAAKGQLLVLLPVDLIGIGITVALFATLFASVGEPGPDEKPKFDIQSEFAWLAGLTSVWHVDMILWWTVFSAYSTEGFHGYDVAYHLLYVVLYGVPAVVVARYSPRHSRRTAVYEWLGVSWYALLVLSVYAYRLWTYVDRMLEFQ